MALLSSTRLELAAKDGTCGHGGELHAGNHRVDAELGLAVHLVRRVETLGGRSDEGEVLGVLERDLVRHRQLRRRVHQSSIIEPLARRRMITSPFSARQEAGSTFH